MVLEMFLIQASVGQLSHYFGAEWSISKTTVQQKFDLTISWRRLNLLGPGAHMHGHHIVSMLAC